MQSIVLFIIFVSGIGLAGSQESSLFVLAGKSFVLLVSTFPFPLLTRLHKQSRQFFKERSEIMTLLKKFRLVVLGLVLLFLLNGCYTTFKTVRYDATGSPAYAAEAGQYGEDNYQDENEYEEEYYQNEELVVVEELHFRPSRLIVKTTYFDYPGYVRRVKYVACDPYYVEEYVSVPRISISLNFGVGVGFRFVDWWDPWYVDFWFGFPPPAVYWGPYPVAWVDPWWGAPVYVPYPVYYPVPIYYPVPDPYYPPYRGDYATRPPRDYKRRDWDRRRETVVTDNRRIVRRGSATSAGVKRRDERRPGTSVRRPERTIRRESHSTRFISRKETTHRQVNSRESTRWTRSERKQTDNRSTLRNTRTNRNDSPNIKRSSTRKRYTSTRHSYTPRTVAYTERTSRRSRSYSEPAIDRKSNNRNRTTYSNRSGDRTKVKTHREADSYRSRSSRESRAVTKVYRQKPSSSSYQNKRSIRTGSTGSSKSYSYSRPGSSASPAKSSYSRSSRSSYKSRSSATVSKKSNSSAKSSRRSRSSRRR